MSCSLPPASQPDQFRLPTEAQALSRLRHEVRTPVSAICGFCELVADEVSPAASAGFLAELRQLHAASVRILAISDDFFADGPSAMRQLDPATLVEQCRAPVAEVAALGDRLVAEAGTAGWQTTVEDLRRIQADTARWLACIEEIIVRHAATPTGAGCNSLSPGPPAR